MYLVVFITLLVSMLGIYTQVFAIQSARLFANQTGVAQVMLTWHGAAASLASHVINQAGVAASGECGLTFSMTNKCTSVIAGNTNPISVTNGASPPVVNSYKDSSGNTGYPHLAPGYNTSLQWNSAVFREASGSPLYIITWAPPPASGLASDPITSPSMGITGSDLLQQLRNYGVPLLFYGTVQGAQLVTLVSSASGPVAYTLPASISTLVANGSVAVISQP